MIDFPQLTTLSQAPGTYRPRLKEDLNVYRSLRRKALLKATRFAGGGLMTCNPMYHLSYLSLLCCSLSQRLAQRLCIPNVL